MASSSAAGRRHPHRRQGGAALLLFMLIVVIGASYMLLSRLNASSIRTQNKIDSIKALKIAKEALIGRAVSDDNRPGSLTCPDKDGDGAADGPVPGGVCQTYLGFFPYRTLEVDELRDGAGSALWYALSPNFRDYETAEPINSESEGQLKVDGASDIVAVILAPGAPFDWQNRDPVHDDADARAQYLEGINADSNFKEFTATTGYTANDRVAFITRRELMDAVEKRILGQVRIRLEKYHDEHGFYPYAALLGSQSPDRIGWDGLRSGFLPSGDGQGEWSCECRIDSDTSGIYRWKVCSCAAQNSNSFSLKIAMSSDNGFQAGGAGATGACTILSGQCVCDLAPGGSGTCVTNPYPPPSISLSKVTLEVREESGNVKGTFTNAEMGCMLDWEQPSTAICKCDHPSAGKCHAKTAGQPRLDFTPTPAEPLRFEENGWGHLIYYAVSPAGSEGSGSGLLQIGTGPAAESASAVVIATGPELSATACAGTGGGHDQTNTRPSNDVCNYLDSIENTDKNDTYTERKTPMTDNYWDRIELVKP